MHSYMVHSINTKNIVSKLGGQSTPHLKFLKYDFNKSNFVFRIILLLGHHIVKNSCIIYCTRLKKKTKKPKQTNKKIGISAVQLLLLRLHQQFNKKYIHRSQGGRKLSLSITGLLLFYVY